MDISWLENTTGSWIERHADTDVSDGVQSFSFTQFDTLNKTYYWRLNITDDEFNVTYIFHFTTKLSSGGGDDYRPDGGGGGDIVKLYVTFTYQDTTYGIRFTPVYPNKYNVDSYKWLFGDGSSSRRRCPTHWYRDPGEYIVTMDLTLDNGLTAMKTQSINVTEFSDLQFLFHMLERDKDRVYIRFGYYEVVFTELSLVVSGMLAAVAVYVSFNDRRLYKGRYRESTATVVLRMIGIVWVMIAIILLIWIRMGGL